MVDHETVIKLPAECLSQQSEKQFMWDWTSSWMSEWLGV